ncbi:DUF5330 domain-containing protein [Methylopila turkensis]|uniref:Uncharacterized protein n=1 Tax=Methylopila turkensis TaxID=1437816 RepID=A0A9W6N6N9_9HYPH|nr:DUF5330 domain-containing protein [Methylopila turkensis]GLK79678.1 hypothetical protein GCM10008174_14190 [Methylopila turkensis]
MLMILPVAGPSADGPTASEKASIDALSALAAAGATVSDVKGFCERQPGACDVGSQALKLMGERVGVGAAMLQDYFGGEATTGAAATPAAKLTAPARDTLTPADRKPAWRGQPAGARAA